METPCVTGGAAPGANSTRANPTLSPGQHGDAIAVIAGTKGPSQPSPVVCPGQVGQVVHDRVRVAYQDDKKRLFLLTLNVAARDSVAAVTATIPSGWKIAIGSNAFIHFFRCILFDLTIEIGILEGSHVPDTEAAKLPLRVFAIERVSHPKLTEGLNNPAVSVNDAPFMTQYNEVMMSSRATKVLVVVPKLRKPILGLVLFLLAAGIAAAIGLGIWKSNDSSGLGLQWGGITLAVESIAIALLLYTL